mmetsp:Transcript_132317/g.186802  ORF Transcript_132317/g.186802 Transcript_132317/m.186802 type:complete len:202 (-) Transcript_132317:37-642(-)
MPPCMPAQQNCVPKLSPKSPSLSVRSLPPSAWPLSTWRFGERPARLGDARDLGVAVSFPGTTTSSSASAEPMTGGGASTSGVSEVRLEPSLALAFALCAASGFFFRAAFGESASLSSVTALTPLTKLSPVCPMSSAPPPAAFFFPDFFFGALLLGVFLPASDSPSTSSRDPVLDPVSAPSAVSVRESSWTDGVACPSPESS